MLLPQSTYLPEGGAGFLSLIKISWCYYPNQHFGGILGTAPFAISGRASFFQDSRGQRCIRFFHIVLWIYWKLKKYVGAHFPGHETGVICRDPLVIFQGPKGWRRDACAPRSHVYRTSSLTKVLADAFICGDRGRHPPETGSVHGGFHGHGGIPIAGWFVVENHIKVETSMGWFVCWTTTKGSVEAKQPFFARILVWSWGSGPNMQFSRGIVKAFMC